MDIVWFILIGLAAGWLAGRTVQESRNVDIAGDMIVGAFCALVGGQVFQAFGVPFYGTLIDALLVVGAALLILLAMSVVARADSSASYRNARHA
jgi:uncharacterized membrane protein YeaQ/YmgE (transglycosylase-associated protein family)